MSKESGGGHHYVWPLIMCLCGVDYFSTLGYQPSIAFEGAGLLSPVATLILVMVTLFGALPIYFFVAGKTPDGVGSVGMIEQLFRGWAGKIVVLVLIGFAATDFVVTKTLSAADAAAHLIGNPIYAGHAPGWMQGQVAVTMFLLVLLGGLFLKGYDEVVGVATVLVTTYLALSFLVVGAGLMQLWSQPALLQQWSQSVLAGQYQIAHAPLSGTGLWVAVGLSAIIFPKLALGMSGFETGVLHIHLVTGTSEDPANEKGRIANTRKLLIAAALIMSVFLLGSAFVTGTGTLIPAHEFHVEKDELGHVKFDDEGRELKGRAVDRALAYLAHGESPIPLCPLFGPIFGSIYDLSTILILWFAGASAMAGLLNMVPRYLPRYGMAPEWAAAYRPLVLTFTTINLIVTLIFQADVAAQGGAYATGVLVLMTSACVGSFVHVLRARVRSVRRRFMLAYFGLVTVVFVYTTAANIWERPDGVKIASCFIFGTLAIAGWSRYWRAFEIRFDGFRFGDKADEMVWLDMVESGIPILIPHRPSNRSLADKAMEIRSNHLIPGDMQIVFVEVERGDTSEFLNRPVLHIRQDQDFLIIRVTEAT
ncbi:MAG: hypothetical protein IT428_11145, partial [Planctomycetaceae bacterium]|nr:hypothetical protein [Planctomycetaceae bacterium]